MMLHYCSVIDLHKGIIPVSIILGIEEQELVFLLTHLTSNSPHNKVTFLTVSI